MTKIDATLDVYPHISLNINQYLPGISPEIVNFRRTTNMDPYRLHVENLTYIDKSTNIDQYRDITKN